MNEKPILMSGAMVRAILEGRKTMTRRVVKDRPRKDGCKLVPELLQKMGVGGACPYGQVGDRLWVKETHIHSAHGTIYRANHTDFDAAGIGGLYGGWKPSIFMPRWASRITLEVVSVRVERLREISEADAVAEGIFQFGGLGFYGYDKKGTPGKHCCDTAVLTYRALWESINGAGSWGKNPWVWVIGFKRVGNTDGQGRARV